MLAISYPVSAIHMRYTADDNTRLGEDKREGKTAKKQYNFRPSVVNRLRAVVNRVGIDEIDVVTRAILKEAGSLPLLGSVPCGNAQEVEAISRNEAEDWVNVGDLIKSAPGDYLLRARGDSMTGNGIEDGDLILIRPSQSCQNNDIAVVLISDPFGTTQATLKRVQYKEGSSSVSLVPMNPSYQVREVDTKKEELKICGVYKGLIRTQ